MQETGEGKRAATRGVRIALFLPLVLFFVAFDFFLPLLWRLSGYREMAFPQGAYVGLFVAQIDLIAFWTALGPGRMVVRLPWGLLAITLTYVVQQSGARLFSGHSVSPSEQSLLAAILLFGWLAVTGSLLAYRLLSRRRLLRTDQSPESSLKFHVRHLIIGTALCGMTLALLNGFGYPVATVYRTESKLLFALSAAAVVNLSITIPAVVAAFRSHELWPFWRLTLAGYCMVVTAVQMTLMCMVMGMPPSFVRAFLFLLMLNGTQCFALLFSLYLIRCAGYDLQVVDGVRQDATAENGAATAAVEADPWSEDES
ncbi:hypothetical protein [Blastopirellula marina]|uniref:Uncharacterized protein n=1 Tax=Blastopirellula marina TaxID=124 RepID=A0A2S8FD47_9BACT|nr:hypothetical protein [Blastopirellula marina]PQO30085.1 hypothetical protein C5Y98_21260 [Blastopirellula marina]PTL42523.1 hypothetical protein C5Y97_21270 [Blastopirellula marina]